MDLIGRVKVIKGSIKSEKHYYTDDRLLLRNTGITCTRIRNIIMCVFTDILLVRITFTVIRNLADLYLIPVVFVAENTEMNEYYLSTRLSSTVVFVDE